MRSYARNEPDDTSDATLRYSELALLATLVE